MEVRHVRVFSTLEYLEGTLKIRHLPKPRLYLVSTKYIKMYNLKTSRRLVSLTPILFKLLLSWLWILSWSNLNPLYSRSTYLVYNDWDSSHGYSVTPMSFQTSSSPGRYSKDPQSLESVSWTNIYVVTFTLSYLFSDNGFEGTPSTETHQPFVSKGISNL